eukprot:6443257-Amphidinium_carterae.1
MTHSCVHKTACDASDPFVAQGQRVSLELTACAKNRSIIELLGSSKIECRCNLPSGAESVRPRTPKRPVCTTLTSNG